MEKFQVGQTVRLVSFARMFSNTEVATVKAVAPQYASENPDFEYFDWENGLEVVDGNNDVWWVDQCHVEIIK